MKKLYFIRHGESELNVQGLYAGQIETPLTNRGREQAEVAGRTLKSRNARIDLIISSPLSRALETARIVADEIDYPQNKIAVDDRATERFFGELEAQPWSRDHTYKIRLAHGAEDDEKLLQRTRELLDWIEAQPIDNILVVGHGASGRALRSLVRKDFPMSHPQRLGNAELHEWL